MARWTLATHVLATIDPSSLVGGVALGLAGTALLVSFGPWDQPYQLSVLQLLEQRYGRFLARVVLLFLAIAMAVLGTLILLDIRPAYARSSAGKDSRQLVQPLS
ncbi:MAG: hypothetical protein AAF958_01030 [Planctomycetota bacterium]